MAEITITERENNFENIRYLKSGLDELFERTGCQLNWYSASGRTSFGVDCPECYQDIIRAEMLDRTAEIIAIKYKYDYFKSQIKMGGLSEVEREILYASLIAADLDEDKRYAYEKIKGENNVAVDGFFNFRLAPLKTMEMTGMTMPGC